MILRGASVWMGLIFADFLQALRGVFFAPLRLCVRFSLCDFVVNSLRLLFPKITEKQKGGNHPALSI